MTNKEYLVHFLCSLSGFTDMSGNDRFASEHIQRGAEKFSARQEVLQK